MNDFPAKLLTWIKDDYQAYPLRFVLEVVAWVLSIGCAIVMAVTVPHPPMLWLYPAFMSQCVIYAWCAYSRKSFGMIANYTLLVTIDCIGLSRLILA